MRKQKYYNCQKCNSPVSHRCSTGFCNKCRDRNGINNPFFGKTHSNEAIQNIKKKNQSISKKLWENPEYREKVILGVSKPRKVSFKVEQSNRITKWYQNNPEQIKIRSKIMKKRWKNGEIEPKIGSINESKHEKELRNSLREILPNCRVQKKTIKINEKWFYPDIVIDNDFVVEFFGDFWHGNPLKYKADDIIHHGLTAKHIWETDEKRIQILKDNNFKVLIIWQGDYLLNKNKIIEKIVKEFVDHKVVKSK